MAETTILNIDFGDTFERLIQIKNATRELKEENDKLADSIKKEGDATGELNKQLLQNEAAIRANTKEQRTLNKLVDDTIKQDKAQKGSIEANRAELSKLTAEYIKLAKPTEEQTARIKQLSDTLKQQESAIGDTRRNVGNYASALEGAGSILKKFGIDTSGLEQKLKSARAALVETRLRLQEVQGNLGGASGATDSFGKGLFTTTKNLFTTTKGLQLLKVALISTGIGAIVVALGSMIALFAKSDKGLDLITKGFTILGAVVDTLVKRVESFVTGLQLIFSGKFSEGIDQVTGSFKGLASEIGKTVNAASALADAQKAYDDAVTDSLVQRAKLSAQIQEQRELAQDETLSIQERIAAQKEAIRIQAELSAIEQGLAKQRDELARQTFELSVKSGEDKKQLKEAEVLAFKEEEARTRERIKLRKELDRLNGEVAQNEKEQIKQTEEAKRKALEDEKKRQEDIARTTKENIQRSIEAIQIETQERKNAALKRFNDGVIDEQEYQQKLRDIEVNALEEKLLILEFYGENIQQAELDLQTKILENQAAYNEAQKNQQEELNEAMREQYQADQDNFIAVQEAKLTVANSTVDALKSLLSILGNAGVESAAFQKALALTQIGIDTARSISAGIAGATTSASATGSGAFVATPVFIATTIATILAAVAQASALLKKTQPPKKPSFAEGGKVVDIGGRSHAHGGTQISLDGVPVAEAEAGEKMFILKKTASDYINKFGMLNQMFGGKSWNGQPVRMAALGGNIASSFDGGLTAREAISNTQAQDMLNAIRSLPAPVVRVTEINKVQSDVNRSVGVSEL